ncbi:MAG: hypothetical protein O7A67_00565, partial [SAR324 cluster bacterium]|nr:hypothetical protein [SAR324 cluster bacterium]
AASAFGQDSDQYELRFEGYRNLEPTQVCSVIDLVILMQNTQAKIASGESSSRLVMFEGGVPPEGLKMPTQKKTPGDVYRVLVEALNLFFKHEGIRSQIPNTPERVVPGDVFVVTSLAFDSLANYLKGKGVVNIGNMKLLRYRYTDRLTPTG